ncbi:embryo defective 1703 [Hibiscus trionum]|uniref:Embryo defective 1703 n=1 Tax=Hibiscus trionum TaxID=183268 RepID=A0A9W7GY66_HIBTR|nr:embryo defective 1703 [Hibiscus trionum]
MELLNFPISKTPRLLSSFSSFAPRIPIKTSNNKPLHRLPSFPPRRTNVFHVSAHFGRKTSRRNSLRKKLTDHQKVRPNPTPFNPATDIQNPNDSLENFGSAKQSDVDKEDAGELKSKPLGESVLLSKLENWVDQYKKDAEFWGIGSGPIFTVSQDVEGNVKGVTVHEDEILKRLEFEDMEKVNSKILYAKNLAREMEGGENVIPRTSSVAKFVVSGEESGFMSGIRGIILHPGFIPKLSSIGTLVLGGLIVLWAAKLFVRGKKEVECTQLEKEMMRRKIRSRKGREILEKGSVEVVQASVEQQSVSFQRPELDKQELRNNILKAKAATSKLALPDSSGSQSSKSGDIEGEIEEIKLMAKKAQETEAKEKSGTGKEEKEVQAANKEFSDEMEPAEEGRKDGGNSLSNLCTKEDSVQGKGNYKAVEWTSSNEPNGDGVKFLNGVTSLDSRVRQVADASSVQLSKDEQIAKEDLKNMESTSPLLVNGECNQPPVIPDNKSYTAKSSSFGKKPRVILSVKEAREFLSSKSDKEKLNQESVMETVQESAPDVILPNDKKSGTSTKQIIDVNNKMIPRGISSGVSESTASVNACESAIQGDKEFILNKENDEECKEEVRQPLSSSQESIGMSREQEQSVKKENWILNNFHEVEPVLKKIGDGFRENYMVARERAGEQLNVHSEIKELGSNEDENELEWMKDDKLRDIVFQVRENELSGRDPFYLMDAEEKLAFFQGLEKKVEKENKKLTHLHEWFHSNIENLDYGADGISLYDPPEKIIPRWKGPPLEKSPEFLSNFQEQREALFNGKVGMTNSTKGDGQSFLKKPTTTDEDLAISSSESDLKRRFHGADKKDPKIVIEGSDGSFKPGKKSGKEFWQHTKKWSRGFLESYNAETDPEVKSIMKDMGKDLDRWITEKEIQEAADLMKKLPERNKKFMEKKLNKIKREMELFGPQAVVSKYQEYAEDKEEDYLWWLDLPHVLCIELYTFENDDQRIGFYALEMAADLDLEPKPHHVIAFEDAGDCKSFCYIMQAHLEMLGNGRAFIVPQPPKDAFREAKANGFGVTVIRKGELRLNVDQTLEEVEEEICEIGSKMYHDKIMRERSVDISSLMKGVLGVGDKPRRRRSKKKKLKKPSKN